MWTYLTDNKNTYFFCLSNHLFFAEQSVPSEKSKQVSHGGGEPAGRHTELYVVPIHFKFSIMVVRSAPWTGWSVCYHFQRFFRWLFLLMLPPGWYVWLVSRWKQKLAVLYRYAVQITLIALDPHPRCSPLRKGGKCCGMDPTWDQWVPVPKGRALNIPCAF